MFSVENSIEYYQHTYTHLVVRAFHNQGVKGPRKNLYELFTLSQSPADSIICNTILKVQNEKKAVHFFRLIGKSIFNLSLGAA